MLTVRDALYLATPHEFAQRDGAEERVDLLTEIVPETVGDADLPDLLATAATLAGRGLV
jgi:hypothetical protein